MLWPDGFLTFRVGKGLPAAIAVPVRAVLGAIMRYAMIRETLKHKEPGGKFKRFARTLKIILPDSRKAAKLVGKERKRLAADGLPAGADRLISREYEETRPREVRREAALQKGPLARVRGGQNPIPQQHRSADRAARRARAEDQRREPLVEERRIPSDLDERKETRRLRGVDFCGFGIE